MKFPAAGGSWYQDPAVGGMVEVRFRTATAMLGRFDVTECQEVAVSGQQLKVVGYLQSWIIDTKTLV